MRRIKLSNCNEFTLVDEDDFKKYGHLKWCLSSKGYVTRKQWNKKIKVDEEIRMHRVILSAKKGTIVDHVNRNKLDNRKSNLRLVSEHQSKWNVGIGSRNKTGFKGVSFEKSRGVYRASIMLKGKQNFIGRFPCKIQAAKEYNKFAKKLFGKYAVLNEIKE